MILEYTQHLGFIGFSQIKHKLHSHCEESSLLRTTACPDSFYRDGNVSQVPCDINRLPHPTQNVGFAMT